MVWAETSELGAAVYGQGESEQSVAHGHRVAHLDPSIEPGAQNRFAFWFYQDLHTYIYIIYTYVYACAAVTGRADARMSPPPPALASLTGMASREKAGVLPVNATFPAWSYDHVCLAASLRANLALPPASERLPYHQLEVILVAVGISWFAWTKVPLLRRNSRCRGWDQTHMALCVCVIF